MIPDTKAVAELKVILEKECGRELTCEEAEESARNLFELGKVMYEIASKEYLRKQRLKLVNVHPKSERFIKPRSLTVEDGGNK